jgi:hypothetical protein
VLQLVAALALGLAMVFGGYATFRLGGSPGIRGMLLAGAITWSASLIAMIVPCLWIEREPEKLAPAMLGGGVARFLLVLFGALPIAMIEEGIKKPFLLWIGICYLAVLAADTGTLLYWLNQKKNQGE